MLAVLVALVPGAIFIYIYGDELTRDNLHDQLSVSMDDIRIRFSETIGEYIDALERFEESGGLDGSAMDIEREVGLAFGSLLRTCTVTVARHDGSLVYSSLSNPQRVGIQDRVQRPSWHELSFSTAFRYPVFEGDEVVLSIEHDSGPWHIFVDIAGAQFVHYADPALVNEVCLIEDSSQMVSSLIHLADYRSLSDGWVFSHTLSQRGGDVLIENRPLEDWGLTLVGYLDISPYMDSLNSFYTLLVAVLALAFLLALAMALVMARSLVRPIAELVEAMDAVEGDDLAPRQLSGNVREMRTLDERFNQMLQRIDSLVRQSEEERERLAEAERKALEAQMNPHFLFNTLNTIRSMARLSGQKDIADMTTRLGRLLRYAVDNRSGTETLEMSWKMVDSYLGIQRVRFQDRLSLSLSFDERVAGIVTPKLIIQPLVENAIAHGLEPKPGAWMLSLSVGLEDGWVVIRVADNGVGFDQERLSDLEALSQEGHTGLYNVCKRLELHYGKKATLHVESVKGEGTIVTMRLPAVEER